MGVAVLRTEDWGNLENVLHITGNTHLLVQLRTLGQIAIALEVLDLEDVAATFCGRTDQLGGEDPPRTALDHVLGEQLGNTTGDPGDGLAGLGLEVKDTVVQTGLEGNDGSTLRIDLRSVVGSLNGRWAFSILDLHGQHLRSLGDHIHLTDVNLKVLNGGGGNGNFGLLDQTGNLNNGVDVQSTGVLDHLARDGLGSRDNSLDLLALLAQHQESKFGTLYTGIIDTGDNSDLLLLLSEVAESGGGVNVFGLGELAVKVLGSVIGFLSGSLGLLLGSASSGLLGLSLLLSSLLRGILAGALRVAFRGRGGRAGRWSLLGLRASGQVGVRHYALEKDVRFKFCLLV